MCMHAMCNTYGGDMDVKRHHSPTLVSIRFVKLIIYIKSDGVITTILESVIVLERQVGMTKATLL